jgi:hypothetical protein
MESVAAAVVALAIILGLVLVVGFDIFCLVRLATLNRSRLLPKWIWALAIVFVSPIGGLAFLAVVHLWKPGNKLDASMQSG